MTNASWTTLGHGAKVDGRPCINNRVASHAPARGIVISHGPIRSRDMARKEGASGYREKPCAVMRRSRPNQIPLKRFGGSFRFRKMPETAPFYGQEGCFVKNFLSVKARNRRAFALRVCSYAYMAKKCQKKFQKNLTKNRRFGILLSRAMRLPFTSYRAFFEEGLSTCCSVRSSLMAVGSYCMAVSVGG